MPTESREGPQTVFWLLYSKAGYNQEASGRGILRDFSASGLLVLLLFAGYIKTSPALAWLPIDLTLLAAVGVAVATAAGWLGRRGRLPDGTSLILVVVASFLPAVIWASSTDYARSKVVLFPVTLLCAVGAAFLISNPRRMRFLLYWTVAMGLTMWLLTTLAPATEELYGRVALEGSGNTIAPARAAGAALVALAALAVARQARLLLVAMVAAPLLSLMFSSGSRGPLVAGVIAVVLMVLARPGGHRLRNTLLAFLLGGAAGWVALASTSVFARDRIAMLFESDRGQSVDVRLWLYRESLVAVWEHPEGLGWGGLAERLYPLQLYPHNIVLEVIAEGGWIPGAVFLGVLSVGFTRTLICVRYPAAIAAFGLLLYWTLNAMVSGDINDNRALFAMLGVALVIPAITGGKVATEDLASATPTDRVE